MCFESLDFGKGNDTLIVGVDDHRVRYEMSRRLTKSILQTDSFVASQRAIYSATIDKMYDIGLLLRFPTDRSAAGFHNIRPN